MCTFWLEFGEQKKKHKPYALLPLLSASNDCGVLIVCVFKAGAKLVFVFGKWGKGG